MLMTKTSSELVGRITPDEKSGLAFVRDTQIAVSQVKELIDYGLDIHEIVHDLPGLEREDVLAVMLHVARIKSPGPHLA